jgi:hypothetical protein|tara:strand:- start:474 stop:644 length:171 start_codon:yes stop_codon:yes gene_type:complete
MNDPITVSYEETTRCTLQFADEAAFEDWQEHGSIINDLDDSQIIMWKYNMEAFKND